VIAGLGSDRPLQGLRVLVVDDDPDRLVILSDAFPIARLTGRR